MCECVRARVCVCVFGSVCEKMLLGVGVLGVHCQIHFCCSCTYICVAFGFAVCCSVLQCGSMTACPQRADTYSYTYTYS